MQVVAVRLAAEELDALGAAAVRDGSRPIGCHSSGVGRITQREVRLVPRLTARSHEVMG